MATATLASVPPKPLTVMQRQELAFIRSEAAEYMRLYGNQKLDQKDHMRVAKALGVAEGIAKLLCETLPERRA